MQIRIKQSQVHPSQLYSQTKIKFRAEDSSSSILFVFDPTVAASQQILALLCGVAIPAAAGGGGE